MEALIVKKEVQKPYHDSIEYLDDKVSEIVITYYFLGVPVYKLQRNTSLHK